MAENGIVVVTSADAEMRQLARQVASRLQGGENLLLYGDLGAGKTTFTQGLAEGFNVSRAVKSPTFTFLKEYDLPNGRLAHYDLYRLEKNPALHELEVIELPDRLTDPEVITVVEWADRLSELPDDHHRIVFSEEADGSRKVTLPAELHTGDGT